MRRSLLSVWPIVVAVLILAAFLELLRVLSGAPVHLRGVLLRWALVQGVLLAARWAGPVESFQHRWVFSRRFVAMFVAFVALLLVYAATLHTAAAWACTLAFYSLLLALAGSAVEGSWKARLSCWMLVALAGGVLPVLVGQIESDFAEEEFFAALQAVVLGILTGLMVVIPSVLSSRLHAWPGRWVDRPMQVREDVSVPRWIVVSTSFVLVLALAGWTLSIYRHSFYSVTVPGYPGVSRDRPFVCGRVTPDPAQSAVLGRAQVLERLLAQTVANPNATTSEYGLLALGTADRRWAEAFRRALLEDVAKAQYTGPANSVKSTQYLAARMAYYYAHVRAAFPDLFSPQDQESVQAWLAAVNRRALTVEWVDWLYALAFSIVPEGPYENQENGAGLLALLEAEHLADADLSERNRDYLARMQRGWFERFRNTDDVYIYQPDWIVNALYQLAFWQEKVDLSDQALQNRALAFEWLLLQALPDGAPLGYNHPNRPSLVPVAFLGASLLDDPRYVWWSNRLLDWAERAQKPVYALPGTELGLAQNRSTAGDVDSPEVGSCLMFGDSGLPTQQGPLAPDKIVFRDGWAPDSQYLLLNLRFSGWHRYKATNTVILIYQGAPIAAGQETGRVFSWLPAGRSLFRDKRIPRENLNGLLVPRTGMSAVLYELTSLGGPWAQDPPQYARVEQFETLGPLDVSRTTIERWREWRHERVIYFVHHGPIVVVDEASSPSRGGSAAVVWHLAGDGRRDGESLWLGDGNRARLVWPAEVWPAVDLVDAGPDVTPPPGADWVRTCAIYRSPHKGRLDLATTFLTGDWVDSQVRVNAVWSPTMDRTLGYRIAVSGAQGRLDLLHNASPEPLAADGLGAEGQGVLVWREGMQDTVICTVDGHSVRVEWAEQPAEVYTLEGIRLLPEEWKWEEGILELGAFDQAACVHIR